MTQWCEKIARKPQGLVKVTATAGREGLSGGLCPPGILAGTLLSAAGPLLVHMVLLPQFLLSLFLAVFVYEIRLCVL